MIQENRPSTCSCGQSLHWFKNSAGAWLPPFVDAGVAYVPTRSQEVVKMHTYTSHECVFVGATDGLDPVVLSTTMMRDLAWEDALPRPCPRCHAEPTTYCWNLADRRQGVSSHTRWPHEERRAAATS